MHMYIQVLKGSIAALAFLHDRNILHRSLGSPSITLSTLRSDESSDLRVSQVCMYVCMFVCM